MQALINNYSAYPQSISSNSVFLPKEHYTGERSTSSASIILVSPDEFDLNSKIMSLLNEYSTLPDNWDEDGAKAPDRNALKSANALTMLLSKHGQPIFHTAPGPNGEIMLDIRNKNKIRSIEIILYGERSVAVLFSEDGTASQQIFNTEYLGEMLQWLNQK